MARLDWHKIDSMDATYPDICPNCGAAEGAEAKILLKSQQRAVHFCDECFTSWEISDDEKKKINIKKDPEVHEWLTRKFYANNSVIIEQKKEFFKNAYEPIIKSGIFTNELGEKIKAKDLSRVMKRIIKLSDEEIAELIWNCNPYSKSYDQHLKIIKGWVEEFRRLESSGPSPCSVLGLDLFDHVLFNTIVRELEEEEKKHKTRKEIQHLI